MIGSTRSSETHLIANCINKQFANFSKTLINAASLHVVSVYVVLLHVVSVYAALVYEAKKRLFLQRKPPFTAIKRYPKGKLFWGWRRGISSFDMQFHSRWGAINIISRKEMDFNFLKLRYKNGRLLLWMNVQIKETHIYH